MTYDPRGLRSLPPIQRVLASCAFALGVVLGILAIPVLFVALGLIPAQGGSETP